MDDTSTGSSDTSVAMDPGSGFPFAVDGFHEYDTTVLGITPRIRGVAVGAGIRVAPSRIPGAGNGLFTDQGFERRAVITWYGGSLLSTQQAKAVAAANPSAASHFRTLVPGFSVVAGWRATPPPASLLAIGGGSFANHGVAARDRNAAFRTVWVPQAAQSLVVLVATKRIESDTEVLVSYGAAYWRGQSAAAGPVPAAA